MCDSSNIIMSYLRISAPWSGGLYGKSALNSLSRAIDQNLLHTRSSQLLTATDQLRFQPSPIENLRAPEPPLGKCLSPPTIVAPIPESLLSNGHPGGQWGMPPLSAYTPFESLLFFQSLATSDVRPASFASISSILSNNQLVRDNADFSADRLSPEALEDLYATLLRDGYDRDANQGPNGLPHDSPSNSKKRKISSPRPDGGSTGVSHAVRVPELVSHLYARYRALVTKEIKEDERRYDLMNEQLQQLQQKPEAPVTAEAPSPALPVKKPEQTEPTEVGVKVETPRRSHPGPISIPPAAMLPVKPTEISTTKPPVSTQTTKEAQPTPIQPAGQPPVPVSQPQPPSLVGQTAPALQAPAPPPLAPRVPVAPATPSTASRPTHPSQVAPRPIPAISPAVGKPGAPAVTPAPKPTFQQWQLDAPPHSPYSAVSPSTTTPQVSATAAKHPLPPPAQIPQSQHKPSIPSTLPSTPAPAPSTVQTPVPIGRPRLSQTPSVVISSFSESRSSRPRLSIDTPGSSTPWKRTPRLSIPESPASPPRPLPEDVSPISERAPSPDAMNISPPREKKTTRRGQTAPDTKPPANIKIEKSTTSRRKRAESSASTRSQARSAASASRDTSPAHADDSRTSRRPKGAASSPDDQTPKNRSKRKRGPSESAEQESVAPEAPKFDNSRYVMCARGFHRTAAPILNDVTTHKLASIFAKPLGERDAPGYHDLIYRPQDLKSIKSAVHQGSKAVASATEAVSTPAADGESPAPGVGASSKNNALMLPKTEDLGIVNSSQLEKEFIRMFANAIMFNPVPERDFGPHFPMINDRGSRESTQSADGDEGGIIQDSREMFEDVEQAVNRWRAAERASERASDELANKNILSLRRGSASDFNADSTDDAKG
ncbi:uncharacterized protein N7483_003964 [Penicillium malachiteum]|uniref:uncharacterized protein n=1 Tax=Penicillium malachiteum TaxID=1324776 RepID=UPI002548FC8D|nr:uncharacterized protein N7483_003964 [Penicillium malachiteum]KAJ5729456.1 hypothetical protein N7483_003964 [Penicillium malachiteum]